MSFRSKVFYVLTLAVLVLGPALTLPALSAHAPILTADQPASSHGSHGSPFAPALPGVAMAIKVKDPATIAGKWKTRASAATPDYTTGVQGAAADFEQNALRSEDTYKASVIEAANKGRYGRGIQGSGAKYAKNAAGLGSQRYAPGIANAQDAYATGMQPVVATLQAIQLPARGVKGNNQERSNVVATALRKMKYGA